MVIVKKERPMKVKDSLILLNTYLKKCRANRSFIICGGASLILQGIISRATKDIDVIAPPIDEALKMAAISVADDLGLDHHWLNNGPTSITTDLREGWQERVIEIFKASNLTVFSISREDLIFSKLWAMCDRGKDEQDLLLLNPSKSELESAIEFVKTKDGNPKWPAHVKEQSNILKRKLGYE